jgi:diphthamide synthase (EF-2-diphthine--ammonia ligase)
MRALVERARTAGVTQMAFGDLFLEDIRAYRERQLADSGLTPIFPLWQRPTRALAAEMIAAGVEAVLTCVDPRALPRRFAGRAFDDDLLADLPCGVDPCGERGEFHTFVHAGPMFAAPIPVAVGAIVERDDFVFADLLARE